MLMHNKNTYKNSQIHKFGMNKTFRKPSAEPSLLELCRGEGKSLKVFIMSSLFVFLSKREFLEVTIYIVQHYCLIGSYSSFACHNPEGVT